MNNKKETMVIREDICTGCGACKLACNTEAIELKENQKGFLVPVIDCEKCIRCGRCKYHCPEVKPVLDNRPRSVWAAISSNDYELRNSTSGGVFYVFGKHILGSGGVVYGCALNENNEAVHICAATIGELQLLMKSKYVQSKSVDAYKDVKNKMRQGIKVLFSGTGCQIAGLYSYLGEQRKTLYTIEIACHGVPSPGLFREYLVWKSRNERFEIKEFIFRHKDKHKKGEHHTYKIIDKENNSHYYYSNQDPYYSSFMLEHTLRESCYKCRYKGDKHIGDILLSDYWGIEKEHPQFRGERGCSAVMVYTEKGSQLFESVTDELICEESSFSKVIRHNKSIINNAAEDNRWDYDIKDKNLIDSMRPPKTVKGYIANKTPELLKYGFIKKLK